MTPLTPDLTALARKLRLHAHELVTGGTNASDLRQSLFTAATEIANLINACEGFESTAREMRASLRVMEQERDEARAQFDRHVAWADDQAKAADARLTTLQEWVERLRHDLPTDGNARAMNDTQTWNAAIDAVLALLPPPSAATETK